MATQTWRDAVIDSLLKEHGYEELARRDAVIDSLLKEHGYEELAQPAKEKTMGRLEKRERKLLKQFFKLPGARRRAGREMAEKAAAFMGVSERDFANGFADGGQEERAALRAVASKDDSWQKHFEPAGEGRDWEGFFSALSSCLEKFLPLILAV